MWNSTIPYEAYLNAVGIYNYYWRNYYSTYNYNNQRFHATPLQRQVINPIFIENQNHETVNTSTGLKTEVGSGNEQVSKMSYENVEGLAVVEGALEPLAKSALGNGQTLEAFNTTTGLTGMENGSKQLGDICHENGECIEKGEGALDPLVLTSNCKGSDVPAIETPAKGVDPNLPMAHVKQLNHKDANNFEQASEKLNSLTLEDEEAELSLKAKQKQTGCVAATLPNLQSQAKNSLLNYNANINKDNFSVKDPCTPEFLQSLECAFSSEIGLMQLRLLEAFKNTVDCDTDFIIAKICLENNANMDNEIFEFIRSELIGWIGAYQHASMDTPIFHSMTNSNDCINIVCDNKFAFKCLVNCVEDIMQMQSMESLKIVRVPSINTSIYCFDAEYEGIASDSSLFLLQLRLHKPKLYSHFWVVASHKICQEERKTHFIFLIDERSALSLNFQYNSSFFICMQQVTFQSRGIVREMLEMNSLPSEIK